MKKILSILLVFVLFITTLVGCSNKSITNEDELPEENKITGTVFAIIKETNCTYTIAIIPNEGENILKYANTVTVNLAETNMPEVGDVISVLHDGKVTESYQLQVNAQSIEIISKNETDESEYNLTSKFVGIIIKIDNRTAIVEPQGGKYYMKYGEAVYVTLPNSEFEEGNIVIVEHDGNPIGGYPLEINTISVNGILLEDKK
ncbi:hypothetical protein JYG23_04200 [Sedimentibacter sp. zth1]|uniref:hypothetical protein n=1 Tax=Sedimentibacter sp. zth1 TaxID=2816908 RepID=UPI001A91AB4C|nr:hypothetical protein [Sedimentibacter sp. zth1]QSX06663.1 hypothetical protein JYG23_04200 [Sedimentibacter sp. zth1]